jgi:hypothetical protein
MSYVIRRLLLTVTLVVFAFGIPTTTATAKQVHKQSQEQKKYSLPTKQERRTYSALWHAVRREDGKRAPGRNIRRWGIATDSGTRPASAREMASSIHALRNLRVPYLSPAPPSQPPSGVQTARATGAPLSSIRACESGGNYATNTGNGFYGAYQFTMSTWSSVGGSGNPANASPAEQDQRAAMLYARAGASPWPVCGR